MTLPQDNEVVMLAVINMIGDMGKAAAREGLAPQRSTWHLCVRVTLLSHPQGAKAFVYGVGIILSAPTFHFQSLLGPQAIRAHRTTHVISSPRDFIPRVLSRLHSTGT